MEVSPEGYIFFSYVEEHSVIAGNTVIAIFKRVAVNVNSCCKIKKCCKFFQYRAVPLNLITCDGGWRLQLDLKLVGIYVKEANISGRTLMHVLKS